MEAFLYTVSVIGFTHIIVDGSIFEPIRNFISNRKEKLILGFIHKLTSCYMCSGLYVGMFCGWASFTEITILQILMAGFGGSFLSNFAAMIFNFIESQTIINLPDEPSK